MASCKLVGLVRVSTNKQHESGLGEAAQRAAIEAHRDRTGCELLRVYTEVESGGHDDPENRPAFRAAVAHAKRSNAALVIARVDRLLRSIPMLAFLKRSGVRFLALDNPNANELTVDILVAVAAEERRKIGERTRVALAAFKADRRVPLRLRKVYGDAVPAQLVKATAGKLGADLVQCRNLTDAARQKGTRNAAKARTKAAREAVADLVPVVQEWRAGGFTLLAIADRLNREGHTTRAGKPWHPVAVKRLLDRA